MDAGGPRCQVTRKDGTPCRAAARPSGFCFSHDPELATRRTEARRRGGRQAHRPPAVLPPDAPDLPLATVADVIGMLGQTINQVRKGTLDARVGNCLAVLAGQLVRAIEGGELERRLEALEAVLKQRDAKS